MDILALALATGLLALHLCSCLIVALRPKTGFLPWTGTPPRVTLLRPVCGLDPQESAALASSFTLDYPALELIFCVADADDPVIAPLTALMAQHRQVRARLLCGEDRLSANPKLNNLAKGWDAAEGRFVVMADSNLLLPPDYIWRLLEASGPGVGLVSCPPVGAEARGIWGALECAFLNSNQARLQLTADAFGMGFAQGKTMMWDREFLNRAGGIQALGRHLAEDVSATHLVRGAGLRVALPSAPFIQPIGRRSFAQVWGRQLRWSKVRRDGFPGLFAFEPLNGAIIPVGLAAFGGGPVAALALGALWYGAEAALARRQGWMTRWREVALFGLRDALIPLIWAASLRSTAFEWRGNAMARGSLQKLPG